MVVVGKSATASDAGGRMAQQYSQRSFRHELFSAFRSGLKDAGYVEGQNVAIDFRWAEGQYSRLPTLAAELVAKRVDVIMASPKVL